MRPTNAVPARLLPPRERARAATTCKCGAPGGVDGQMTFVVLLAVALGLPGLAAAAHLALLAAASLLYREPRSRVGEEVRFLVLIPAHNEATVIGACLEAIAADARPRDLVLVVADRCTDGTASIARRFGASVLERGPDEQPGRAAARQAGLEHARALEWDAVVMLDADSVIAPGFFDACEQALGAGADAVQARSESKRGRTLAAEASLAAFALQGITLPRGRDRLRLSVRLRGTGMAIRRPLALAHRFRAPASEDLVFTLDLILDGTRCRHVDAARLRSEGESSWSTFGGQKVRYEAGRMAAARAYVPRLLARVIHRRDFASLEAAWFLATPPFALAVLSLLVALGLAAIAQAWSIAAVFGAGLLALALVILIGLIQARAGLRTWLALLAAPWYLGWKAVVQLRALASVLRRDDYYPPTARV
jgi:cellulose synthase/poly-beta-1,6-N-acetylglucosamine synthase-like glycosyltransferase